MTLDTLSRHGVTIHKKASGLYEIPGNQQYRTGQFPVEGDYSQAAFWLVSGLSGGKMTLTGLSDTSLQGDKGILQILESMGGSISKGGPIIAETSRTHGTIMDAENVPDLVPAIAALASVSEGRTEIIHGERVRLKECDRLHAMAVELSKLGADIREKPDGLIIEGKKSLHGGTVSSWNDHRIAMALAAITPRIEGNLTIEGAESVKKSYPRFWDDFKKAGGKLL
jgi:3-phosphoshikimate 1-carboxyvinyltransferase